MPKTTKPAPRFVLSPDDLELLSWIDEWRVTTAPLVAMLRGTSTQAAYHRLRRLGSGPGGLGYVEGEDVLSGAFRIYHLTRKGQRRIASPYAHATPQPSRITHDLAVAQVCGVWGTLAGWGRITSERSIARDVYIWRTECQARRQKWEKHRRRGVPTTGEPAPSPIGLWTMLPGGGTHAPDAVIRLDATGGLMAIEAELSMKDESRLRAILSAYASDGRFERVLYFAGTSAIKRKVEALAADINASAINSGNGGTVKVRVHPYEPLHSRKNPRPPEPGETIQAA
jgi:hypothetical protein